MVMKNGLFELRMKSKEGIGRVLYCTLVGKRIIMLHSFITSIRIIKFHPEIFLLKASILVTEKASLPYLDAK